MSDSEGERRRRILADDFTAGAADLSLDEIRERRDEARGEIEYLSYLRRFLHVRIDVLRDERSRRGTPAEAPVVDRLSTILGTEGGRGPARGGAVRLEVPEEEMQWAADHVGSLIPVRAASDPGSLSDEELDSAIDVLEKDEREISDARRNVMESHDRLQSEFKQRYRERLSS